MTFKFALIKIISGFIMVFCAFAIFILWLSDPLNLTSPKDKQLVVTFYCHRTAFEKIRQMATEDRQQVSYISASNIEGKISEARKQEYKKLLSEISPDLKVVADYDATMRFIFASGGLSAISPGWLKGIEYVSGNYEKKGVIIQNLDNAHTLPPGVYLRQIEPQWFIVYQQTE